MPVELTDDPTAFLARDWSGLVAADPTGTFFHTPAYLKLWWEEFGRGRLLLAFVADRDRTVAASGFELVDSTLTFLGGFDVTDYMGPVGLPGLEERAAKELMAALVSEVEWDRADLRSLPLESPWLRALESAAASQALRVERGLEGAAPMIPLPPTHQEYLASFRHEIVRKERRLVQEKGEYRVTLSTAATITRDMDRFLELHRSSPGPKGRFMRADMEIFFRRLAEAFLPPGIFHLSFLEVGGIKAAGAIAFSFKDMFYLYNSAFDRHLADVSPGIVLVSELITHAIEAGAKTFDLLKGDLEYKRRFGATRRSIGKLVLER
jgi:CelD/BcsL family acetyltransferase involved in cellulose biosynthesis